MNAVKEKRRMVELDVLERKFLSAKVQGLLADSEKFKVYLLAFALGTFIFTLGTAIYKGDALGLAEWLFWYLGISFIYFANVLRLNIFSEAIKKGFMAQKDVNFLKHQYKSKAETYRSLAKFITVAGSLAIILMLLVVADSAKHFNPLALQGIGDVFKDDTIGFCFGLIAVPYLLFATMYCSAGLNRMADREELRGRHVPGWSDGLAEHWLIIGSTRMGMCRDPYYLDPQGDGYLLNRVCQEGVKSGRSGEFLICSPHSRIRIK